MTPYRQVNRAHRRHATIADAARECLACSVGLVAEPIRAPLEIARRDAAHARVQRRQRLTRQLAIAVGWRTA